MTSTMNINGVEISRYIEEDVIKAISDYMMSETSKFQAKRDVDTEDIKNYCLKMEHLQKVLDAMEEKRP